MVLSRCRQWLKHRALTSRPGRPHGSPFHPRLELLEDRLVPAVTYHGGALLANVGVEALYYGSAWNNSTALTQRESQPLTLGYYSRAGSAAADARMTKLGSSVRPSADLMVRALSCAMASAKEARNRGHAGLAAMPDALAPRCRRRCLPGR